jgi:hypothetical protein
LVPKRLEIGDVFYSQIQVGAKNMKMTHFTCLVLLFTLALSSDSFSEEDKSHLFKSRDIFDLEYANDPRISPDGKQIVYERHSMDQSIARSSPAETVFLPLAGRLMEQGWLISPRRKGARNYMFAGWIPDRPHC